MSTSYGNRVDAPRPRRRPRFARRATAVCVLTAVIAGLLQLTSPSPALAGRRSPVDVPALKSEKQAVRQPEVPPGDFTRGGPPVDADHPGQPAKDRSKSFDPAKSKVVKRTAKADVYENQDGTNTAVLHTSDVNWQDAQGTWKPIDPTFGRRRRTVAQHLGQGGGAAGGRQRRGPAG